VSNNIMQKRIMIVLVMSGWFGLVHAGGALKFQPDVTLDDAVKQINQQAEYKVLATKTDTVDGQQVHEIKVLSPKDGRIQYIRINVKTGEVIK